ncbi:hypothetical protein, conserved [Cyanidioschyzon merolae strain 10D]|jgi:hypothetical protein|uniref:Uncharacterized protein n=1 Tax=Cyanidioschyzon merolae (strain NIES-3377 / 10D) TaxID=280699 RepID=M1US51_CYAM1|nr:hypothetical protein, conserved [Cyanidioschyzon merolae strain 10D]BAM80481.1 hypothetical protein, conserved [Cyanidioschyzon merolae strain 10D]|eukprot:XP_005536517.1 hypothetical protein, conserved [Cyanidioschyzon merolae strain 10D]
MAETLAWSIFPVSNSSVRAAVAPESTGATTWLRRHRRHCWHRSKNSHRLPAALSHVRGQYRSPRSRGKRDDDGSGNDSDGGFLGRGGDAFASGRSAGPGGDGIFGSPVVLEEGNRLMRDHAELLRLGQKYKLFDREGKLAYIAQMESVFDRWKVFLKRFELSTDFQAQLYLKQLDAWLAQFGMRREDLLRNLEISLDMMRQDAEREL